LWQRRFWTHGWHAQAQLERVFPNHRNDHGQTSLTVPPPSTATSLSRILIPDNRLD
jgi:hypothetical protein